MPKTTKNKMNKIPLSHVYKSRLLSTGSGQAVRLGMRLRLLFIALSSVFTIFASSAANALTHEEKVVSLLIITSNHLANSIPPEGVCVFSETRLSGHRQCFTDSVVKLNDKLDNQVSSISVSAEYKITVYQDENFAGGFASYDTNTDTLDIDLDNTITSVAVAAIGDETAADDQVNPNDADLDGVNDVDDFCEETAPQSSVNEYGCSNVQVQNGGVGAGDTGPVFQCIDPTTGAASNDPNCPEPQRDSDFDGTVDAFDPYPLQADSQCVP